MIGTDHTECMHMCTYTHKYTKVDEMRRQFQQLLRDAGLLEPPPGSGHAAPGGTRAIQ